MQRSKKKLCPRDRPESVQKYDSADTLSFILLVMDGGTQKVDFGKRNLSNSGFHSS